MNRITSWLRLCLCASLLLSCESSPWYLCAQAQIDDTGEVTSVMLTYPRCSSNCAKMGEDYVPLYKYSEERPCVEEAEDVQACIASSSTPGVCGGTGELVYEAPDQWQAYNQGHYNGYLVDSPVEGALYYRYASSTSTQSEDTDATKYTAKNGRFDADCGSGRCEQIEFFIGGIALGRTDVNSTITPLDLVKAPTGVEDPRVVDRARLLMSLDEDHDPDNGIKIDKDVSDALLEGGGNTPGGYYMPFGTDEFDQNLEKLVDYLDGRGVGNLKQSDLVSDEDAISHLAQGLEKLPAPLLNNSYAEGQTPCGEVHLNWNEIDQAKRYFLFKDDMKIAYAILGGKVNTTFDETSEPPGSYTYRVAAVNDQGLTGELSNAVTVNVTECATEPDGGVGPAPDSGEPPLHPSCAGFSQMCKEAGKSGCDFVTAKQSDNPACWKICVEDSGGLMCDGTEVNGKWYFICPMPDYWTKSFGHVSVNGGNFQLCLKNFTGP